jgi:hypothetical protein
MSKTIKVTAYKGSELSWGNGERSAAQAHKLVSRLFRAFEEQSGLQQGAEGNGREEEQHMDLAIDLFEALTGFRLAVVGVEEQEPLPEVSLSGLVCLQSHCEYVTGLSKPYVEKGTLGVLVKIGDVSHMVWERDCGYCDCTTGPSHYRLELPASKVAEAPLEKCLAAIAKSPNAQLLLDNLKAGREMWWKPEGSKQWE